MNAWAKEIQQQTRGEGVVMTRDVMVTRGEDIIMTRGDCVVVVIRGHHISGSSII
jgi:hypothetical protein